MKGLIKEALDTAHEAICRNDFRTALDLYNKILAIDPNDDTSLHFISFILNAQGKYKTALDIAKRAIERYRCSAMYYTTLASIYRNLGKYPEAVNAIKTACELKPTDSAVISNAAMILADERKYERAKEIYEIALEFDPDNSFVHFNYSLLLLLMGDFKNGWQEHEWRIPLHYGKPRPDYLKDLRGKNVRIIPEQGCGDFIMFSRYFKSLEEAGASVYIECPRPLVKLYDCHYCFKPDLTIPVMSLPLLFDHVPNEPYIKAPGSVDLPGDHFKVGVATRAVKPVNSDIQVVKKKDGSFNIIPSPANLAYLSAFKRSLPHDFFDPMMGEIKFYNLQNDVTCYGMENMSDRINDFGDLANFVDRMDLIITIDTALAHLAGAMGKKTWLLLPYDFDWRWQIDREDSPWYPTMRIFRQPSRGDWDSVQEKVVTFLTDVDRYRC